MRHSWIAGLFGSLESRQTSTGTVAQPARSAALKSTTAPLAFLCLEHLAIQFRALHIVVGVSQESCFFLWLELADNFRRRAEHENTVGERLPLGNERTCADQRAAAYHGMIEDDRADSDERAFADSAAVQHCLMAHGHVLAKSQRDARVRVQDCGVLDVSALAQRNDVAIAADHRTEPDA